MDDPLATYLDDHLAGAAGAIDLLENLRDDHAADALGQLVAGLLIEVEQDREELRQLRERVKGGGGNPLKEAISKLGEKASRLKLDRGDSGAFGTFEAIELVSVGVLGKAALWRALAVAAPGDARLQAFDFDRLLERAHSQHERLERERLALAPRALGSGGAK